jgi:hypothetical protein
VEVAPDVIAARDHDAVVALCGGSGQLDAARVTVIPPLVLV